FVVHTTTVKPVAFVPTPAKANDPSRNFAGVAADSLPDPFIDDPSFVDDPSNASIEELGSSDYSYVSLVSPDYSYISDEVSIDWSKDCHLISALTSSVLEPFI